MTKGIVGRGEGVATASCAHNSNQDTLAETV